MSKLGKLYRQAQEQVSCGCGTVEGNYKRLILAALSRKDTLLREYNRWFYPYRSDKVARCRLCGVEAITIETLEHTGDCIWQRTEQEVKP